MASTASEVLQLGTREKALILSCESLGFSHASNSSIYQLLRRRSVTDARLLVPCPWARHAVQNYSGEDVGVSIMLVSENEIFHCGPITSAPSLVDGTGGFPFTTDDLWSHADTVEVHLEARAQLERAILWGFDISHLASHLDAMIQRPEFFDILLDLALEYRLPLRIPQDSTEDRLGFAPRELAIEAGVILPDWTRKADKRRILNNEIEAEDAFIEILDSLENGVTEITFNTSLDTPESQALFPQGSNCPIWHNLLLATETLHDHLASRSIRLTSYRELRNLSRSETNTQPS